MWFFSVEAWTLFFRVGYLLFVVLSSAAAMVFCAHLVFEGVVKLRDRFRPNRFSHAQVEHLLLLIQSDWRWLAHDPVASALTERYLSALSPDWQLYVHPDSSTFRKRIGLEPGKTRSEV